MTGFTSKRQAALDKVAQPEQEQEPVAWMCSAFDGEPCEQTYHDDCENPIPLYTAPPKRPWVGLTDEERQEIALEVPINAVLITEAKLKEQNT